MNSDVTITNEGEHPKKTRKGLFLLILLVILLSILWYLIRPGVFIDVHKNLLR